MPPEQTETVLVDFITHSEVIIAASPSAIWPHIIDTNSWYIGQRMTHDGGPRGEVGERFVAATDTQPDVPQLRVENAELEPNIRRTIRLHDAAGGYLGYASWVIEQHGESCTVGYHTYCRYPFPANLKARDVVAQAQRTMDDTFLHLKRVVETK